MELLWDRVRGRLRHGWDGMDAERKKEERGEAESVCEQPTLV